MTGEWLLLINTSYNAILLLFASQLTHTKLPIWRIGLVALLSSIIGLWLFPSVLSPILSFLVLLVAFPYTRKKHAVLLFVGSLCIGGLLTVLQAYVSNGYSMHGIWLLLAVLVLLYVGRVYRLRWQLAQQQLIVSCELTIDAQIFQLEGFIDTGNTCIEPISALPVHFVAMPSVAGKLSESLITMIQKKQPDKALGIFRKIYLSTVHGEQPILAMRIDTLKIDEQLYQGHYIAFIEKQPTFGRAVDVILHSSMLSNY